MKKYVVPLFLAACLLLTACGPKAPDTAEPSDPPSAAPETTDAPTPEPTAEPTPEPTAAPGAHRGGGDRVCPLRGQERRGKGAQPLAPLCGKGHGGELHPRRAGYADVYGPGCRAQFLKRSPAATDETRRVRVAADTELLESGILTAWLPAFETATGYIAEVYAGDASVLAAAAAAGEADVLLMKGPTLPLSAP